MNQTELQRRTGCTIGNILNNFDKFINNESYLDCVDELHMLWKVIYNALREGYAETRELHYYIQQSAADKFWLLWLQDKRYFDKIPQPQNYNDIMPVDGTYVYSLEYFLKRNHLNKSFYKHKQVAWSLCCVLECSQHYQSYTTRYSRLERDITNGLHIQPAEQSREEQEVRRLALRIRKVKKGFNRNSIIIFRNAGKSVFVKGDKVYINKNMLLRDEVDLLSQCLELLRVPIKDIVKGFTNFGQYQNRAFW